MLGAFVGELSSMTATTTATDMEMVQKLASFAMEFKRDAVAVALLEMHVTMLKAQRPRDAAAMAAISLDIRKLGTFSYCCLSFHVTPLFFFCYRARKSHIIMQLFTFTTVSLTLPASQSTRYLDIVLALDDDNDNENDGGIGNSNNGGSSIGSSSGGSGGGDGGGGGGGGGGGVAAYPDDEAQWLVAFAWNIGVMACRSEQVSSATCNAILCCSVYVVRL
jgi:uncharacterized membrane protein YgcG